MRNTSLLVVEKLVVLAKSGYLATERVQQEWIAWTSLGLDYSHLNTKNLFRRVARGCGNVDNGVH
jgi:ribosomal protein L17